MAARDDARTAKDKAEEPSVDDLARQIEALRADVMTLAETLKALGLSKGRAAADGARGKAEEARAAGEAHAEALRGTVEELLSEADTAARQKPVTAMGLAAGFGFLIGLLLARR